MQTESVAANIAPIAKIMEGKGYSPNKLWNLIGETNEVIKSIPR